MANVQLQADPNSNDGEIIPESEDATVDKTVLVLFDEATPRDQVIDSLQRIQEVISRAPLAAA